MRNFFFFPSMATALMAGAAFRPTTVIDARSAVGRAGLYTQHKKIGRTRYSGEELRLIRAEGQHRECERRRRRMSAG